MGKQELVEFIAAKAGLTKADASRALDAAIEGITTGLKKEGKVALVGFGTFSAKERAAREGINPLTKESIKIPAKTVASFKAGSKLKDINKIFVENGEKHGSIKEIIAKAKENRIVLVEVDKSKLDSMVGNSTENHQGVVAIVPPFDYCEVEDILQVAKEREEDPFILILDGIEDPHNLGSIIRTAETAGVHGIIIPKRRSVAVNSTVAKVSTGAISYMKIARVNNINDCIRNLKNEGLWIIGTDGSANTLYYNQDLKGPLAIIIGSEGFGMSKLVKENADILIKIPMKGKITSLNASVSAGIVIYEAVKQRQ